MAIVAIAGPLANLMMALLYALPIRIGLITPTIQSGIFPTAFQIAAMGIRINLILFAFNLLPIPPLDGFTILLGLLPAELAYRLSPLRQYGPMILMIVIFLPMFVNADLNILFRVIDSTMRLLIPILTGMELGLFNLFLWA